jgi:hypothetical protein
MKKISLLMAFSAGILLSAQAQKPGVENNTTFNGNQIVTPTAQETSIQQKPTFVVVSDNQHQPLKRKHAQKAEKTLQAIRSK